MAFFRIYSKRTVLLLLIAMAVIWIPQSLFTRVLGAWGYIIGYPSVIAIMVILIVRQSWKDSSEIAVTTERLILVSAPFKQVCERVPQVMKNCGWKLMQANERRGYFESKIGISRKTWWQVIYINLNS